MFAEGLGRRDFTCGGGDGVKQSFRHSVGRALVTHRTTGGMQANGLQAASGQTRPHRPGHRRRRPAGVDRQLPSLVRPLSDAGHPGVGQDQRHAWNAGSAPGSRCCCCWRWASCACWARWAPSSGRRCSCRLSEPPAASLATLIVLLRWMTYPPPSGADGTAPRRRAVGPLRRRVVAIAVAVFGYLGFTAQGRRHQEPARRVPERRAGRGAVRRGAAGAAVLPGRPGPAVQPAAGRPGLRPEPGAAAVQPQPGSAAVRPEPGRRPADQGGPYNQG